MAARRGSSPNASRRGVWLHWLKRAAIALVLGATALGVLRAVARALLPPDDRSSLAEVILDPGHGGQDPGALSAGRAPLREKDVALDIARRTASLLRAEGLRVSLTREEDETVSLTERISRAGRLGGAEALLISIHCNHAEGSAATGIETWHSSVGEAPAVLPRLRRWGRMILGREIGLAAPERVAESERLAQSIQRILPLHARRPDRGVRDGSLYLTRCAAGPAVLVECGFLSNPAEVTLLASESHRQRLAEGLAKGIREYREARSP